MSWDRCEYDKSYSCVCGKGKVIRHLYREDDDWNRTREGCISEEIICEQCNSQYHIEHYIRHFQERPWEGDGISDRIFLVPNGLNIPKEKEKKNFYFVDIKQCIASEISFSEIKASLEDMIENTYSTKLSLKCSKRIVDMYYKRYKRKKLSLITPVLKDIIDSYDSFEWTPEKISKYRIHEKIDIEENKKEIEAVLSKSFELK